MLLLDNYTTCAEVSQEQRTRYMHATKSYSYSRAISLIKKHIPELYDSLGLMYYNPWHKETYITKNHLIITWSAIEFFIPYYIP